MSVRQKNITVDRSGKMSILDAKTKVNRRLIEEQKAVVASRKKEGRMIPEAVRKLALDQRNIAHDIIFFFGKDYHTTYESGRRRWLAEQLSKYEIARSGKSYNGEGLIIFRTDILKPVLIGADGENSYETLIFKDNDVGRVLARDCLLEYRKEFSVRNHIPVKLFQVLID